MAANDGGFTQVQINQLQELFRVALEPINTRLSGIETRMINLETSVNILTQRQSNSLIGRSDELAEVARGIDGKLPSQNTPQAVEFPPSIECLLAADNEMLPSGAPNKWNKRKSMALLQFYGDDEHTDTEDDNSVSSPARRLRLAKKIGVTRSQLNFAQMHL